jgi:protein-disulfide isomerase
VADAPLQMIIFSDFECPACRALSEQIPQIMDEFKDKIDISYYYYPLDQSCNANVHRAMHQHACKAAAAAICLPERNFYDLHEMFFKNQDSFRGGFVENFISENKIDDCVNSQPTQDRLKQIIQLADPVHISSTPTFILNGSKFEGVVPYYKLKIILESLLKKPNQ